MKQSINSLIRLTMWLSISFVGYTLALGTEKQFTIAAGITAMLAALYIVTYTVPEEDKQ